MHIFFLFRKNKIKFIERQDIMKKIISLILATILSCMLFTACGNGETTMDNGRDTNGMDGEPYVENNGGSSSNMGNDIKNATDDAVNGVEDATKGVVDGVGDAVKNVTDGVGNAVNNMTGN